MTIYEPSTLLTDYLLAGLGGFLTWRLWQVRATLAPSGLWWLRAMSLLTLSAFIGGSHHGFAPNFLPLVDHLWWLLVLWTISFLAYAMGAALVAELVPPAWHKPARKILLVKLLLSLAATSLCPFFLVAMIDYGSSMLAWLGAAFFVSRPWRWRVIAGVLLSALAGWIQQQSGLRFGVLNQNDLFHLLQALALIAFGRVARSGRISPRYPIPLVDVILPPSTGRGPFF